MNFNYTNRTLKINLWRSILIASVVIKEASKDDLKLFMDFSFFFLFFQISEWNFFCLTEAPKYLVRNLFLFSIKFWTMSVNFLFHFSWVSFHVAPLRKSFVSIFSQKIFPHQIKFINFWIFQKTMLVCGNLELQDVDFLRENWRYLRGH